MTDGRDDRRDGWPRVDTIETHSVPPPDKPPPPGTVRADTDRDRADTADDGAPRVVTAPYPAMRDPRERTATAEPEPVTSVRALPARPHVLGLSVRVAIAAAIGGAAVTLGVLAAGSGGGASPAVPARAAAPIAVAPAAPATGNLTVAVHPSDVTIRIDDLPPHVGSPYTIEVAPGEHRVEIQHEGYETWTTSVDVKAGVIQTVQAALVEDSSLAAPTVATLALDSTPRGLDVILDGTALEYPTPIRMGVAPGRHRIVVKDGGTVIWSREFEARANHSHRFHAAAPGTRRGRVDAAPAAADPDPDPVATADAAPAPAPPPAPDAAPLTPPPPLHTP